VIVIDVDIFEVYTEVTVTGMLVVIGKIL